MEALLWLALDVKSGFCTCWYNSWCTCLRWLLSPLNPFSTFKFILQLMQTALFHKSVWSLLCWGWYTL
jgi:hypothetical protein